VAADLILQFQVLAAVVLLVTLATEARAGTLLRPAGQRVLLLLRVAVAEAAVAHLLPGITALAVAALGY
jgi:hypothetical protein